MKTSSRSLSFPRAVLAGLLAGIIAAAANFLYVFIYRSGTGVEAYEVLISPLTIFIGFPILLTIAGILFYILKRSLRKGTAWYSVFVVILTLFALVIDLLSPGEITLSGYKGLLFGLESITGFIAAFLLPYLAKHPKIFMTQQGLKESR